MNKRHGMEALMGIGGGQVSRESQRNLEKAEDLCRKRKPEKALPFLYKAMEDGNNLDAAIQMGFLMPNLDMGVKLLETAEEKGKAMLRREFGNDCFDDGSQYVGHFWGVIETRPYMRVRQAQVRFYFENKQFGKSAETITDMLRLCPDDNMGQRDWASSVLIKAGRAKDALSLCQAWLDPNVETPERGGTKFTEPSREPLSPILEEKLSKWTSAELAYGAALASFTLWGDCLLARQYLRIGAKTNPTVLMKILAKVAQPQTLNMNPRTLNGPEAAHDYLWLTQDLWMKPNVWMWADGVTEAKTVVLRTCSRAGCGKREERVAEFKKCSACKDAIYCGAACQKEDWKTHKPKCQENMRMKEMMKALSMGKPTRKAGDGYPIVASTDFTPDGIATRFHN